MTQFAGKVGLIVGVASKRSIAWAIAQSTAKGGARLALTYQERFEGHVSDLAQGLEQPLVLPCDLTSDDQIAAVFARRARLPRAWRRVRPSRGVVCTLFADVS